MPRGGQPPAEGWQERFLNAYEKSFLIKEAVKPAGISKEYLRTYRKSHPEFNQAILDLEEAQIEALEQIAVARAAAGSDQLLMFLLKSRKPEVYGDNFKHHHEVEGAIGLSLLNTTNPVEIPAGRRREAAKLLMAGDEPEDIPDVDVVED